MAAKPLRVGRKRGEGRRVWNVRAHGPSGGYRTARVTYRDETGARQFRTPADGQSIDELFDQIKIRTQLPCRGRRRHGGGTVTARAARVVRPRPVGNRSAPER